jgi:hypothetical protein
MKREKRILVTEVRRVTDEKERISFELRSEIDEKNINLRVAERRIRKLSGEGEGDNKMDAGKNVEAKAKVNAQLMQLRSKLKTLLDRKARGEGVEGGGVDVLIKEVSSAIRLLEQHKVIIEGGQATPPARASALNFKG